MSNTIVVFLLPSFAQHAHDVYIDIMLSQLILFNKGYFARRTDRLKGPIGRSGSRLVGRSVGRPIGRMDWPAERSAGSVGRAYGSGKQVAQAECWMVIILGPGLLGLGLEQ